MAISQEVGFALVNTLVENKPPAQPGVMIVRIKVNPLTIGISIARGF